MLCCSTLTRPACSWSYNEQKELQQQLDSTIESVGGEETYTQVLAAWALRRILTPT